MANDNNNPGDISPEDLKAVNAALNERARIAKDIEMSTREILSTERSLVDQLTRGAKKTLDFSNILEHVLKTSNNLGKEFKTVEDIQQKMQTDAKFFKKMQEEIGMVASRRLQRN